MVKKWITFSDLCILWNIQKRDLADIVNNGKLQAVFENDASVLHIVDGGSFVKYKHPKGQISLIRQDPLTADEMTKLVFLVSDVEEYEKKNGISPNWEQKYRELEQNTFETCFDDAIKLSEQDEEIRQLKQNIQSQEMPKENSTPMSFVNKAIYKNAFICQTDFWEIWFQGIKLGIIKNLDGIHYIAILLDKAGTSMSCRKLYHTISGKVPDNFMSEDAAIAEGLNIVNSKQAIGSMRKRKICSEKYQELQDKLADASMEEQEEIREQMAKLEPYLDRKERNFTNPNDKKAQINIGKRLETAYKAIHKANMKELEKYLRENIKPDDAYGLMYTGSIKWDVISK